MKRMLALALLVAFVVAMGAGVCAAKEKTYHWKIGHIRPEGTAIDKDVKWFVEKVTKDSDGRITFDIYPTNQLGDYTVVQERCGMGDVDMYVACLGTTVDKRVGVYVTPYLVKNWEEARKVYARGSTLQTAMDGFMSEQNLKMVAGYPVYFGGIITLKEPPAPGDPNVPKKIKIRVPPMKAYELSGQALGYIATPIAWADAFTSMQTGIVNGAIGAGAEGYYANFRDLAKYFLAVNDHLEFWYLYMNLDLWNKLSDKDKAIIQDAADEMEARRWTAAEADEKMNMKKLEDYGVKVLTFSNEELQKMSDKARAEVWPSLRKDVGEKVFDEVTKDLK